MALLNTLTAITSWLVLTTFVPLAVLPYARTSTVMALLFFNNLNLLIAICEIILGVRIRTIQADYRKLQEKYKGKEAEGCVAYLFQPMPNVFDSRPWSQMWASYALLDPSYQNQESFGFFVDFGNGMSTILPCLLWNYAMAYPDSVSPLLVGCVGLASYWQILYGTLVYWLSYWFNERYKGRTVAEVVGFIGCTNGFWVVFPIYGIRIAVIILRDGNLDVFQSFA